MSPEGEISRPEGEGHRFRLEGFEGPLDLLLHLVRINEVDLTNLPIVEIARQYDAYLDAMREMNLEVAGEYLVMAATLVHIKSRLLLPPEPGSGEEGEAEDPRAELVQQLEEYQRYKQAAENLQAIESVRSLIWTRDGRIPEEFAGEEILVVDLYDVISAFRKLLGRLGEEARIRLRRDDVSVADRIGWLTDVLEERGSVELLALFEAMPNRIERIATFLAVLEMMRLRLVLAYQRAPGSEIRVALRADATEDGDGDGAREDA